jgi:hypothetical protein
VVVFGKVARESMADEPLRSAGSESRGELVLQREGGFGRPRVLPGFGEVARRGGFDRRPSPGTA